MTTQLLKRSAGFSLVELMIAVIIMGLLTAIALPIYTKAETRIRGDGAVSFLISTAQKLEDYYALYSTYPATLAEIGIAEPALDPWGNPYQYMPIDIEPPPKKGKIRRDKNMNPLNTDFDLYSYGPDGRSQTQLTANFARDDIVRAGNGSYVGKARDF